VIGRAPVDVAARRVGIEHEFQLFDELGPRDARTLWPALVVDGARLDPGDANAVRCRWGGVFTTDGREAEVATPPTRIGDDGVERSCELADVGASVLAAALPAGVIMRGYSTHLNVEVDDRRGRAVAQQVTRRMAPALMLLLDGADSPGLLVRPRHRRLEIGGEFQRGDALLAAFALALGVVLAGEAAARGRAGRSLPPELDLRIVASPQRYGWYIDRHAGADDLYSHGRAARLRTAAGTSVSGQAVIDSTWAAARPFVDGLVSARAVTLVDDVVSGHRPLPCEVPADATIGPGTATTRSALPPSVLDARRRNGCTITTAAATWHAVTMRAEMGGVTRWIRVPGERIDEFLAGLDGGELDAWLPTLFRRRAAWLPARRLVEAR
jgi:hypothetical protein